jgi:TRAP-type mannitol/chloroaromatic compound transport system permease large subunit
MKLSEMYRGVIPFIVCQVIVLALVISYPPLTTWLPKVMYGN